jgi:predicted porin
MTFRNDVFPMPLRRAQSTQRLCAILGLLAMLGVTVSTARAQAPAGDGAAIVTIYGIVDTGVRHIDQASAAGSVTQVANGLNTSRFGIKGAEAIAPALNAIFRLEGGLNLGTGASSNSAALFDRSAYAGIAGMSWSLRFGRQEGFGYELAGAGVTDPLAMALNLPNDASPAAASGQGPVLGANPLQGLYAYTYGQLRYNNAIKATFQHDGFNGGVLYALGGTAGSSSDDSVKAVTVGVQRANVQAQALLQDATDATGHRASLGVLAGTWRAAEAWKLQAGVHGLHVNPGFNASGLGNGASSSGILGNTNVVSASVLRTGQVFHETIGDLGLTWAVTPSTPVTLAAYRTTVSGDATPTSAGTGGARSFVLLAKYLLSKRSTLYAEVDTANVSGTLAVHTVNTQDHELAYMVGVNHRF